MTEAAVQRLFFALWPPDDVRRRLARESRRVAGRQGRVVAAGNLHLTLVFLGSVDADRRRCMEQAVASIRCEPFQLTLSRVGYWPRPRVLWLGAEETPASLGGLVADLVRGLVPCGHEAERRRYEAHLTIVRKARRASPVERLEPIVWPVDDFCLVESVTAETGAEYQVLRRWPLVP